MRRNPAKTSGNGINAVLFYEVVPLPLANEFSLSIEDLYHAVTFNPQPLLICVCSQFTSVDNERVR
jgi:hypothetical protein